MVASLRPVKDNNHVVPKPKEGSNPPIFGSYEFRSPVRNEIASEKSRRGSDLELRVNVLIYRHERHFPSGYESERLGSITIGERRTSTRHRVEGSHGAHRDMEGSRARPLPRRPIESLRRRSRRPGRARRRAARRLRLSDRIVSLLAGSTARGPTSFTGNSARTLRSKDCPTMRCASATVIRSAARCSRSRSLALPAIASAFG